MDPIFINSENSQTSKSHVSILKLTDKGEKGIVLSNLSIYYTWKNIQESSNKNKFKISTPIWHDEFELPNGSYSLSDIPSYFQYRLKRTQFNHLASLAKWLSVRLRTKWFWVRVQLQSLHLQISRLL